MGIFYFSSIYGDHRHLRFVMRAHCVGTTDEEHFVVFITVHGWNRCSSFGNMHVFCLCKFGLKTPYYYSAPAAWNSLPPHLRTITDTNAFKRHLKSFLFSLSHNLVSAPGWTSCIAALYKLLIVLYCMTPDHSLMLMRTSHKILAAYVAAGGLVLAPAALDPSVTPRV